MTDDRKPLTRSEREAAFKRAIPAHTRIELPITVERHDEPHTSIGYYDGKNVFRVVASLATFHHEAAGWADAIVPRAPIVRRPREYDGCPCNRCKQGWTQSQANPMDRELDGDRR